MERAIYYIVLLQKLTAVSREQAARSIVQKTKKVDMTLGSLDLGIKLLSMIADGDQLDNDFLPKINKRRDERCC